MAALLDCAHGLGVAAGSVQRGGHGPQRVAHRAGLHHAVPRARDGPALPALDVRRTTYSGLSPP
jgi:hypothetical protein